MAVFSVAGHAQFASSTETVEVYATVTGTDGQPAVGLTADAFTVLDEGSVQPVTVFAAGTTPLTLAIAVDRSFSMTAEGLDMAKAGARRLLDGLRADDRVLLLTIGGGVERIAGFDTPRGNARSALDRVTLWGSSPIGDTVTRALEGVADGAGRRAVVIWSDGLEREAQTTRADVLDRVRRSNALIYPVAVGRSPSPLLTELAALSGGRLLPARDRAAAVKAAAEIATELRYQYLLGYARPAGAAGWRRIEVKVNQPALKVRARQGYFAPAVADESSRPIEASKEKTVPR